VTAENQSSDAPAATAPRRRTGVLSTAIWATGIVFGWLRGSRPLRAVGSILKWVSELNTHHYDENTRRRLKILNLIALLIAVTTLIYSFQHLFIDYDRFAPLIWVNLALVVMALCVPLSHSLSPIAGGLIVVGTEWIALALISNLIGANSGVHLQYFIGCAAPFVVFGLERIKLVLATVVSGIALHVFCHFNFPPGTALIKADKAMIDGIYMQAAITTGAVIAAAVWYAFRLAENAKAENDRLLRNILPDAVVDRLKRRPGEIIADTHDVTSVMFADISGSVVLAQSLGPERMVRLLNDIIRSFDKLAERHGVEKIKTIGDAYMAAAGVPDPVGDPAQRMIAFAASMLDEIDRVRSRQGIDLHLRVGIATGPVLAGVIGAQKFSYDIWGDTVNLAARLEGQSERGEIFVCETTKLYAGPDVSMSKVGTREIRGFGARELFVVDRRRAGTSPTSASLSDDKAREPQVL